MKGQTKASGEGGEGEEKLREDIPGSGQGVSPSRGSEQGGHRTPSGKRNDSDAAGGETVHGRLASGARRSCRDQGTS